MDLKTARGHVQLANQNLEKAIKETYAVGTHVQYRRGSQYMWQSAEVERHGYNGDVRVRLSETGRLVWARGAHETNLRLYC